MKETLLWSDYQFYIEERSRIDSRKTTRTEAGFGCPFCHEVIHDPITIRHGQTYEHRCGLRMTRYGNGLDCEIAEDRIQPAEADWASEIDG